MSKVFIGVPAYNGERFIREAINSLINQTYTDWEMLISDDASKDRTREIAEEYAKKDSRIKYYKQEKNLGLFGNYKFVLDKANRKYFMCAAQDDLWEKDYIKTCVDYLEKDKNLGMATTCNETIDSFGRKVLESPWMANLSGKPSVSQITKYVLEPEVLGKNNLMYGFFRTEVARAVWNAYPQRYVWGQDYHVGLAIVSHFPIAVDKRILFKKRLGGFSSPQLLLNDKKEKIKGEEMIKNPKNKIFPFGRFRNYFSGHMEALQGTPYRLLVAFLLMVRLPRSFIIHIKERSFKNIITRIFEKNHVNNS